MGLGTHSAAPPKGASTFHVGKTGTKPYYSFRDCKSLLTVDILLPLTFKNGSFQSILGSYYRGIGTFYFQSTNIPWGLALLDPMFFTLDLPAFQMAIPPHWNARENWPPQDQTAHRPDSQLTPLVTIYGHFQAPSCSRPTPLLPASQTPARGGPGAGGPSVAGCPPGCQAWCREEGHDS